MRKWTIHLALASALSAQIAPLCADSADRSTSDSEEYPSSDLYWDFPEGTTIEGRLSCFIPQSSLVRDIYGYCGINYEVEGTIPAWKALNVWWALDYVSLNGKSEGLEDPTTLRIFPITLGLKALFRTRWFQPYFGLGMRYFFIWNHNDSPYVQSNVSKNGMGGVAEIGTLFQPIRHFVIDIFANYSYRKFDTHYSSSSNTAGNSLNVGGWNLGGGIGYQF